MNVADSPGLSGACHSMARVSSFVRTQPEALEPSRFGPAAVVSSKTT
jgi:hypothetical protein